MLAALSLLFWDKERVAQRMGCTQSRALVAKFSSWLFEAPQGGLSLSSPHPMAPLRHPVAIQKSSWPWCDTVLGAGIVARQAHTAAAWFSLSVLHVHTTSRTQLLVSFWGRDGAGHTKPSALWML